MNWFTDLIAILRYYLQIRAANALYDLQKKMDDDARLAELQIAALRNLGDSASQLAADRLRDQQARRAGIFVPVPPVLAAGPAPSGGKAGSNG